jgi:hypothetical protein
LLPAVLAEALPAAAAPTAEPPVIVRLPRFEPLQEIVIPAVARAARLTELELAPMQLFDGVFELPHAGKLTGIDKHDCIGVSVTLSLARREVQAGATAYQPVTVSYPTGAQLYLPVDSKTFQLSSSDSGGFSLAVAADADRPVAVETASNRKKRKSDGPERR